MAHRSGGGSIPSAASVQWCLISTRIQYAQSRTKQNSSWLNEFLKGKFVFYSQIHRSVKSPLYLYLQCQPGKVYQRSKNILYAASSSEFGSRTSSREAVLRLIMCYEYMKGNGEIAAQHLNSPLMAFAKGERFPGTEWSQIGSDIFKTEHQNFFCYTGITYTDSVSNSAPKVRNWNNLNNFVISCIISLIFFLCILHLSKRPIKGKVP